jgi:hypothetical protein
MDGKTLAEDVRKLLLESDSSTFINDKVTYDFLYEAALHLNGELQWVTDTYNTTTVANQKDYILPVDFQELYAVDDMNRKYIYMNTGTDTVNQMVMYRDDDKMIHDVLPNQTKTYADFFNIRPDTTILQAFYYGSTATATHTAWQNTSVLEDSSGYLANAQVGDTIHNTTRDTDGYVIFVTDSTHIVTALFGTGNTYWTSGDAYILKPQHRLTLHLEPYPTTSGVQIYVPYVKAPYPVYCPVHSYPFPETFRFALVKYAAWLYKYLDREPNYGDMWYKYFDENIRKFKRINNRVKERSSFRVNFNKRSLTDRSWR